jgi:hypothetical protein
VLAQAEIETHWGARPGAATVVSVYRYPQPA